MEPFIAEVTYLGGTPLGGGFVGGVRLATGDVNAAADHDEWIIIESMSSPIFR